ncbi:hypothetical protein GA0070620_1645 [Micromonospora krabiensis]|uniref:Uncharacterized protein n=1 Tax=Micromonospora krabiensis TaxID=307121 RepID=A0A1C3N0P9_9ACTN|nr:hypothetical protein GA0070620_1645 [Micromonospora krabiensis]
MTARVVADPRRGAVLRVVGANDGSRRGERAGRRSPVRARGGPAGPPRRDDDRRWETQDRGWENG